MPTQKQRILVIDDNPETHSDFSQVFQPNLPASAERDSLPVDSWDPSPGPEDAFQLDVELAFATQGEQGLQMAQAAVSAGRPFYMAFIDIRTPPGLDGIQTIQRLWRTQPDLQCVICTAHSDYDWSQTIKQLGRSPNLLILKKPFDSVEVLQIALALAEKSKLAGRVANILRTLEQRVLERTMQAEAACRAKSDFLANMSHEIRTPMTAILGYADMLLGDEEGFRPEQLTCLETIRRNGEHLLCIVNDILDLSKIEAGKVIVEQVACSPVQIVNDVLSMMRVRAEAKHLVLRAQFIEPLPVTIFSDPVRLRQIFINLVGNAIKFTDAGEVRIEVSCQKLDASRQALQFDVIDTGIGISPADVKLLFVPFVQADSSSTRKFGGTGLGLTISRRMAHLLEGEIEVQSAAGLGSRFRLLLALKPHSMLELLEPAAIWPHLSSHATVPSRLLHSSVLAGTRLLVVEDGPDNQRLIGTILRKAGAEVTLAENGQLALDQITAYAKQGEKYDIILTDMAMPVMDGYEMARHLRGEGYSGKIIALTAHAMSNDQQRCIDAGCDHYASKPINREDLIETIVQNLPTKVLEKSVS